MSRPIDPAVKQAVKHWTSVGRTTSYIFKLLRAHGLEVSRSAVWYLRKAKLGEAHEVEARTRLAPARERVLELFHTGWGVAAIASEINASQHAVWRITRAAGARRCGRARNLSENTVRKRKLTADERLTPELTEQILALYHTGHGSNSIASRLKCPCTDVERVMKAAGPRRCGRARHQRVGAHDRDVPSLATRNALRRALDVACQKLTAAGGFDDEPAACEREPGRVIGPRYGRDEGVRSSWF